MDSRNGKLEVAYTPHEPPVRISEIQTELADLLLKTAEDTFQMGVGIASGGEELKGLI